MHTEVKTTTCYMCACRCGIRVHLNDGELHPKIVQKAQGFTGGSFNTREFFHGRPDRVVRAVRWTFLTLVYPVPAWLLVWGSGSLASFIAAFALQFAGLLAERWVFFAEARHPQNLYYQAIS